MSDTATKDATALPVPEPGLTPAEVIRRAEALRPRLLDDQAATEERTFYSEETQKLFTDAGFYRILQPRMFGGYEFDIRTFYRTIIEVARGCPSSGWLLCLGAGHALQLGSFVLAAGAGRIFGPDGHFIAPLSVGNFPGQRPAKPVDGGYLVSGKWRYARACRTAPTSWDLPRSKGSTLLNRSS